MSDRIANRDARTKVEQCVEFTGSNTHGTRDIVGGYPALFVYSYDTLIGALVQTPFGDQWWENITNYSPTTARHKSQLRPRNLTRHEFGHGSRGDNNHRLIHDLMERL